MKEYHEPRYKIHKYPLNKRDAQHRKAMDIKSKEQEVSKIKEEIGILLARLQNALEEAANAKSAPLRKFLIDKVVVFHGSEEYESAEKYEGKNHFESPMTTWQRNEYLKLCQQKKDQE